MCQMYSARGVVMDIAVAWQYWDGLQLAVRAAARRPDADRIAALRVDVDIERAAVGALLRHRRGAAEEGVAEEGDRYAPV